jgi:hypothetical protein
MIAAYSSAVAEEALAPGAGNNLGVFGSEVATMQRLPDTLLVGDTRTTLRVTARSGTAAHVVVWRRGPLVAHLSVTGDQTLAAILLGHAAAVADWRLSSLSRWR